MRIKDNKKTEKVELVEKNLNFVKQMTIAMYLSNYSFGVDMSYQRPYSPTKEFIKSLLSNVYHTAANDIKNKNKAYLNSFETMGGKIKKALFNVADGSHRTITLQKINLVLAFVAKKEKNEYVAKNAMLLFSKNQCSDFIELFNYVNVYYKNSNIDYTEQYKIAVAEYISFYSKSGLDKKNYREFKTKNKKNNFALALETIHNTLIPLIEKYGLDFVYEVFAHRSFIGVYELPKYISEQDYFRQKNSPANIQEEEDLCKVVCMTSNLKKREEKKLVESIKTFETNISKFFTSKESGKVKRHLFRAAYMSLKFQSIEDCKVISVERSATENRVSQELDISIRNGDFSANRFYEKAIEFSEIYGNILDSDTNSKFETLLPIKNFISKIGETKYRFLPFFLELVSYSKKTNFTFDYLEINKLVSDCSGYLVQRSVYIGANTEKQADGPFSELVFFIKNTRNVKEVRAEFKKVLSSAKLFVRKEDFEKGMKEMKKLSSNFRGIAALLYEMSFVLKHSSNFKLDFEIYHSKFSKSQIDHILPVSLDGIFSQIDSEEKVLCEVVASKFKHSAANALSLPAKYNNKKSDKLPCEFREEFLSKQESVTESYKDMIIPTKEDFESFSRLSNVLNSRIEQYLDYVLPNMTFCEI